jgi:hypothetical protein
MGNADETAIFFDMPCDYIVNFKREKVAVKTVGYKNLLVPVVLCITANGNKLPCMIL